MAMKYGSYDDRQFSRHLGDGTFGRVVEAKDKNGDVVAIKIIKPVKRYVRSA